MKSMAKRLLEKFENINEGLEFALAQLSGTDNGGNVFFANGIVPQHDLHIKLKVTDRHKSSIILA